MTCPHCQATENICDDCGYCEYCCDKRRVCSASFNYDDFDDDD